MYLKERKGGGWRVIVQHNGLKASGTAPTRAKAQQKGAELLVELGGDRPSASVTVGELLDVWTAEAHHSLTYGDDIRRALSYLPGAFLERELRTVDTAVINALYKRLAKEKSPWRVRRVHGALSAAWKTAIGESWALTNPCHDAKLPPLPPTEMKPPTSDQVKTLLAGLAQRPQLELFVFLACTLGSRRGETMALQWQDVSPGAVIIRRSVSQIGDEVEIRGTKTGTKGHRTVAIGPLAAASLEAEHARQTALATKAGLPAPVWVFDNHDAGQSHRRPDYYTQAFIKLRKSLGVEGVRLHGLRHYVATQLLNSGEDPATVAHRLGHSTTATTLRTYSHWVKASDQRSAGTMEGLVGQLSDTPLQD